MSFQSFNNHHLPIEAKLTHQGAIYK
jgi:hypothetical protein